jgi:hypothetical protein
MSQWITLSEVDLLPFITAAQSEALATRSISGPDPVALSLTEAIERVRGEVRSQGANLISATPGTIAPELASATVLIALSLIADRLSAFVLSESQAANLQQVQAQLEAVRSGQFRIEPATDAPAAPVSSGPVSFIEVTTCRKPRLSAQRLRRL